MRCLITGCEGFIGSHLADYLVARGVEVCGMAYGDTGNIDHLQGRIAVFKADLNDKERVEEIVRRTRPNAIFHLAAQSFVGVSWNDPEVTLRTNVLGSFYLLETIRQARLDPTIIVVGSSSVCGPCDESEMPLGEAREFRPTSMYATSKVAEEMLGHFYWRACGLKAIRVRPFNMTGPRKVDDACSDFAKGIAEMERGERRMLDVGNLETVRDFTDGRDAVKALWLLLERGAPGEVYNLCSGRGRRMREILDMYTQIVGRDIPFRVVPEKLRPFDDPIYVGDNAKLRALGWAPETPFERTLEDLLDYWRARAAVAA